MSSIFPARGAEGSRPFRALMSAGVEPQSLARDQSVSPSEARITVTLGRSWQSVSPVTATESSWRSTVPDAAEASSSHWTRASTPPCVMFAVQFWQSARTPVTVSPSPGSQAASQLTRPEALTISPPPRAQSTVTAHWHLSAPSAYSARRGVATQRIILAGVAPAASGTVPEAVTALRGARR